MLEQPIFRPESGQNYFGEQRLVQNKQVIWLQHGSENHGIFENYQISAFLGVETMYSTVYLPPFIHKGQYSYM